MFEAVNDIHRKDKGGKMKLASQEMRKLAPELDPLRIGTGWKKEDLGKPQIIIESTFGDSHPGSGHLDILVEEVRKGVDAAGQRTSQFPAQLCHLFLGHLHKIFLSCRLL